MCEQPLTLTAARGCCTSVARRDVSQTHARHLPHMGGVGRARRLPFPLSPLWLCRRRGATHMAAVNAGRDPASPNALRLTVRPHDPCGAFKIVRYTLISVSTVICIQACRRAKGGHALAAMVLPVLALLLTHNPAERVPSGCNALPACNVLRYSALCASSH